MLRIAWMVVLAFAWLAADGHAADVRVAGPGSRPVLGFACCDGRLEDARTLLGDPAVRGDLKALQAELAVPVLDFSKERADLVRSLTGDGIPVIAWLTLAPEDGLYMNADNEPKAEARVRLFVAWTRAEGLHWKAVGLDIEPNFAELGALKNHRWRLLETLAARAVDGGRLKRAQRAYSKLIGELQAQGYVVQTYQMPYVPAERSVRSTVADRLLGTVDVRGNEEYLMLYSSYAPQVGAGMIWSLGRNAQGIAIGSTDAAAGSGALDWDAFSRDLIVASHFSKTVGVYNLEGCVRQGFLARLVGFDWGQTVVIPAATVARAERMGHMVRAALWTLSHAVYLLVGFGIVVIWLVARWRRRRRLRLASAG